MASVGLSEGLIASDIFATIVVMVLVTTVLTPIFLRMLYPKQRGPAAPEVEAAVS